MWPQRVVIAILFHFKQHFAEIWEYTYLFKTRYIGILKD